MESPTSTHQDVIAFIDKIFAISLNKTLLILFLFFTISFDVCAQTNRFVDPAGTDSGTCSDYGSPCQTIDYAVSQSANGDLIYLSDGTFSAATISERITLKGNGAATIVQGITVSAAENSTDLVTVSDLTVSGTSVGVLITTSYVTLDQLDVSDHTSRNVSLNVAGDISDITITDCVLDGGGTTNTSLHISESTGVDGLTVLNTRMDNSTFGAYFANGSSATLNHVENVIFRNCTFNDNLRKGIYVEKLQNALFENISVINSGTDATYDFNNGIDINLKWQAYTTITIRNSRVTGCGAIGINDIGTSPENRRTSAIAIKARTDAPSYTSPTASLTNVTLDGVIIDGLVTDLRFGEMGKTDNDGIDMSTVTVSHCTITNDNLAGLLNEENTNTLTISDNYWNGAPSGTDIEDYGSGAGSTSQSGELVNQIVDESNNSYTSFANALAGVAADGTIQNIPTGSITGTTTISNNVTLSTPGAGLLDATNSLTTYEDLVVNGGDLTLGSDFSVTGSITLSDDVILGDYNVDGAAVAVNSGASIQDGIDMIASGGTVTVASGTFAESLSIEDGLTLDGSAGAILEPASPSTAIDIDADNVTVDGFQIGTDASTSNATIGLNSFRNDNITIQNNTIFANTIGINSMISETGTTLIDNNVISMLALEDVISGGGSIGLNLQHVGGDADADITDNDISNAVSGIVAFGLVSSTEALIDGGNYTGCTTGILPINTDGIGFSSSALTIQNLTMSAFATDSDVSDTETGVYVVTAGGTASDDITVVMDNLDISGVNNDLSNYSGIVIGDFPTASDGAGIDATIINCNIHDNSNRGIYSRGEDAVTNISQTSITGNGFDPTASGGNPGFSVIAREGAATTVSNCFITNPATLSAAEDIGNNYYVSGLHISTGGTLTVSDCSLDDNGNGFIAQTAGIDLSGNFFNTIDEATIDAAVNSNDFTPWLANATDTDVGTAGFQGDFSNLIVGISGAQTGAAGRVEEGISLVDAAGTVTVNAGTYPENLTVSKSVTLNGANQGIAGSDGGRTAESILEPSSANVGITIGAADITIDGFQFGTDNTSSNHTTAISNTGFSGLNASNNVIHANSAGVLLAGMSSGATTVSNNLIEMLNLEDPLTATNPSIGIYASTHLGTADVDLSDNDIMNASFGILGFALTSSNVLTVDGGNITGCTKGIEVDNADGTGNYSPSDIAIQNVTMSGFAGPDAEVVAPDAQAGIYLGVFSTLGSGSATDADDISATITNVDISGVSNTVNDYSAIYVADFNSGEPATGTSDLIAVDATITDSDIHDNLNRGIYARGANATVSVSQSTFTGNGSNPTTTGSSLAVFASGTIDASNNFFTNPGTGTVSTLFAQQTGTITASDNSLSQNSNGLLSEIQSSGVIDMSGNWLGETDGTTINGIVDGSSDFTPYLQSGTDSDLGTNGFQGDFDALTVTSSGGQTSGDRIQEGHDLVNADGLVTILQADYAEALIVSQNISIDPESGTTIDDITLNGGNFNILNNTITVDNSLTMTSGVFDIDQEDGDKSDDPVFVLPGTVNGSSYDATTHFEGRIETSVTGASTFTFEVGDEGAYRPATLTPTTTTTFQAAHIAEATPTGAGATNPDITNLIGDAGNPSGTIESVLNFRYWDIDVAGGGPPGTTSVALQITSGDNATDPSSLGMTRFDGTDWEVLSLATPSTGSDPYIITGQTSSFSEFSIYSTDVAANPLPVELIAFEGRMENDDIRLSWATLSEVNSDHFEIERSGDGVNFNALGRVAANGNSNQRIDYGYLDMNVKSQIHYYRLKMVDFDGSTEYSSVVRVAPDLSDIKLKVYPNPASDFIQIEGIDASHLRQLTFYDLNGSVTRSLSTFDSSLIDTSSLPSGHYLMRLVLVDNSVFEGKLSKK